MTPKNHLCHLDMLYWAHKLFLNFRIKFFKLEDINFKYKSSFPFSGRCSHADCKFLCAESWSPQLLLRCLPRSWLDLLHEFTFPPQARGPGMCARLIPHVPVDQSGCAFHSYLPQGAGPSWSFINKSYPRYETIASNSFLLIRCDVFSHRIMQLTEN